jgi:hypothetical protein
MDGDRMFRVWMVASKPEYQFLPLVSDILTPLSTSIS